MTVPLPLLQQDDTVSELVRESLKRWVITAAHCCAKWGVDSTDTSYIIMADSITGYFGEHSGYNYEHTGPTLKPERD